MQKTLLTTFGLLAAGLLTAAVTLLVSLSQDGAPPGFEPPNQNYPGPNVTFTPDEPAVSPTQSVRPSPVLSATEYQVVTQGDGASIALTERLTRVLFSQSDLEALWLEMYPDAGLDPPIPQPDFTENAVLAAFGGTQTSGGSQMRVSSVDSEADSVLVTFTLSVPGENCISTSVITQPFILVSLPNTGAEFRSQILQEQLSCE